MELLQISAQNFSELGSQKHLIYELSKMKIQPSLKEKIYGKGKTLNIQLNALLNMYYQKSVQINFLPYKSVKRISVLQNNFYFTLNRST